MDNHEPDIEELAKSIYKTSMNNKPKHSLKAIGIATFIVGLLINFLFFPFLAMLGWNLGLAAAFGWIKVSFLQSVFTFLLLKTVNMSIFGYKGS